MLIALVVAGSVAGVLAGTKTSNHAETSQAPPQTTTTATPGESQCGGGLSVGPNTSCAFAQNVENAYHGKGGPGTFQVYSPVIGQTVPVTCILSGSEVVCSGGNNATVSFPQ